MKPNVPDLFKRKVLVDKLVKAEASKDVVDALEYKRHKQNQRKTFIECEKLYFPSKNKG